MKAKAVVALLLSEKIPEGGQCFDGDKAKMQMLGESYAAHVKAQLEVRFRGNSKPDHQKLLALRRECGMWLLSVVDGLGKAGVVLGLSGAPLDQFDRMFEHACGLTIEQDHPAREQRPATAAGRAGAPREEQHQHLTMSQLARVSVRPANGRPNPAAKRRNVPRMR